MLRDMFKKTYTKIDTRYRAPEAEQTEKQEEGTGDSGRNVEKVQ